MTSCGKHLPKDLADRKLLAKLHTNTRLHTCPSTIHLEMSVLPSLPGWNLMVADRGLMLEMTRFDGDPGSSVHNRNISIYITIACELKYFFITSLASLHPASSLSFKANSYKRAHNSLQSRLGFVYSSVGCVWVYDKLAIKWIDNDIWVAHSTVDKARSLLTP